MKTPPLLLFAALVFWGWQSNLLLVGALTGALLEAARVVQVRWDLEDADFHRIGSFCILVVAALGGYFLTNSSEGAGLAGIIRGQVHFARPDLAAPSLISMFRWLPLVFLPFIAAQVYNVRPTVPLTAVSLMLRLRRRRGEHSLAGRYVDFSYSYFILCIFSAGIHSNQGTRSYFWGQLILILWVLWALRPGRFGLSAWLAGLLAVAALGFSGQVGINRFEQWVQNVDAQWLARLLGSNTDPSQSVTALGQIGRLKLSPRIVIRLEPGKVGMAPDYLREASYRTYHNQTWFANGSRNDFIGLSPPPDNYTWTLLPGKAAEATVTIACYLNGRSPPPDFDPQGLLPLPSGTCRLENLPLVTSVITLQTNKLGAVLATGSGLLIFDARYGPGATFDSPPDPGTNQFDLAVPTNEVPALEQVITELNLAGAGDKEKRAAVERFFAEKFAYSSWQGPEKRAAAGVSPLTRFLLSSRSGHCEYFATATVLLLRELHIPARYAVGYYVHETSGSGYVVRERDAHAWCLVWNRQTKMWEDFDTTPSSWVAVEDHGATLLDALSDARSWLVFQLEKLRWRQTNLRQYILWTIAPVLVVLLYYILFQRRARKSVAAKKAAVEKPVAWPGEDSAFYRLEAALAAHGVPREPSEPLTGWLERALTDPALADLRGPLRELLQLHYRYRFDPPGLAAAEKKWLVENTAAICGTLQSKAPSPKAKAALR